MEDKLDWIKFSGFSWTHDNKGVFYASFDKPEEIESGKEKGTEGTSNLNQKLYYHVLGTKQEDDKLIYSDSEHPNWMWGTDVSDDGKYLIVSVRESCEPKNLVFYADISNFNGGENEIKFIHLIDEFEEEYEYITNEGSLFYFQTKEDVLCIDLENPAKENWKTIIPKGEDTLEYVVCVNSKYLVATFIHDVKNIMQLYSLENGELISTISLPTVCS